MGRTCRVYLNLDDLRRAARRRLPRTVFDFVDGGAEDEQTLAANRSAFSRWTFRPRVLVDVSRRDASTTLLGERLAAPLVLAPTGLAGLVAPDGEILAARAASRRGVPFVLSTAATCTVEERAKGAPGPLWFQLYVWRDRGVTRELVERVRAAGYTALFLTVDVPVLGQRERDLRNGFTIPPRVTPGNALDMLAHLPWLLRTLSRPRPTFKNFVGTAGAKGRSAIALGAYINSQMDPAVTWADLDWLRSLWPGRLAVKGIMTAEDARRAVEAGVDAVVVSNHGGRQLDGLPGAVAALPEVAAAVAGRAEVVLDGGVRRGTDVVKAVALGARACMIGRPFLYGLGADGQAGVERAIAILEGEIDRALALLGRPTLADLSRDALGEGETGHG